MFHGVDVFFHLPGEVGQVAPDQDGAADVVLLGAGQAALALLDAEGLLGFALILLNLPADGTHILRIAEGVLRKVVGHAPFRAAVSSHDPEQFHPF